MDLSTLPSYVQSEGLTVFDCRGVEVTGVDGTVQVMTEDVTSGEDVSDSASSNTSSHLPIDDTSSPISLERLDLSETDRILLSESEHAAWKHVETADETSEAESLP